jgi:pimeloyl-ACP methyl ester carboxylesterase
VKAISTSAKVTPKKVFTSAQIPAQRSLLTESSAQSLLDAMLATDVSVPQTVSQTGTVRTAFAKLSARESANMNSKNVGKGLFASPGRVSSLFGSVSSILELPSTKSKQVPPLVLLHGFDSSAIEFRRIAPLLSEKRDVYIPDILGWGFSDHSEVVSFDPEAKMAHLKSFIREVVGGPCVVVGASLGGALAIRLAVESPELVDKVVFIDAQGFIDGKGPSDIPNALAK